MVRVKCITKKQHLKVLPSIFVSIAMHYQRPVSNLSKFVFLAQTKVEGNKTKEFKLLLIPGAQLDFFCFKVNPITFRASRNSNNLKLSPIFIRLSALSVMTCLDSDSELLFEAVAEPLYIFIIFCKKYVCFATKQ